jgi:ankyrin repeat protein
MISLLLDAGAQIDAKDRIFHTPLQVAALHGHCKSVALLTDRGAAVDIVRRPFGLVYLQSYMLRHSFLMRFLSVPPKYFHHNVPLLTISVWALLFPNRYRRRLCILLCVMGA